MDIGPYQNAEFVTSGGMAQVYKAEDAKHGLVAIKVLLAKYNNEFGRDRFAQEVSILTKIKHHAVVPMFGTGEHEGRPYLTLRFMAGGSLPNKLWRQGLLTPAESLAILTRIASALDAFRNRRIIHRDLKPDNILLDAEGHAYISDFGLAKIMADMIGLNSHGAGTWVYASPEQVIKNAKIDHRTDIYSLGIILFEMLTGYRPYPISGGRDGWQDLLKLHEQGDIPHYLRDGRLHREYVPIIEKALATNPDERYYSAAEMVADFERVLRGQQGGGYGGHRTHPTPLEPTQPHATGVSPAVLVLGALVAVLAFTSMGLGMVVWQMASQSPVAVVSPTTAAPIVIGGTATVSLGVATPASTAAPLLVPTNTQLPPTLTVAVGGGEPPSGVPTVTLSPSFTPRPSPTATIVPPLPSLSPSLPTAGAQGAVGAPSTGGGAGPGAGASTLQGQGAVVGGGAPAVVVEPSQVPPSPSSTSEPLVVLLQPEAGEPKAHRNNNEEVTFEWRYPGTLPAGYRFVLFLEGPGGVGQNKTVGWHKLMQALGTVSCHPHLHMVMVLIDGGWE